jgi:RNA polymerase sigma factor (sigma-70 family)
MLVSEAQSDEVLALNNALSRLESINERLSRIVECRYFAGLSIEETAEALSISPATVKRDWTMARAWLHRALSE